MNDIGVIRCINGGMAIVDACLVPDLSKMRWTMTKDGYVVTTVYDGGWRNRKTISMHRIVNDTMAGFKTDHKNGIHWDNRVCNLRTATHSNNTANRTKHNAVSCSSTFKGVSWRTASSRWVAQIQKDGKKVHLGYFRSEIEAARAYDKAADELFGQFAKPNGDSIPQAERI